MIRKYKILLIIIISALNCFGYLSAQTKIQVVTRTVSHEFDYKPGSIFEIKGEKANISIKPSAGNTIKIKLHLISKNPSKKIAENDLQFCDYLIKENNNSILVSNFFNIKNNFKEISSNMSARYELEVPRGIILRIKDIYGGIELNDIECNLNLSVDFGQIKFLNISGSIYIESKYSDIKGQNTNATLTIKAQKADINIQNINGLLKISNQYGSVNLENINAGITVDAEMTEIKLAVENPKKYSYDFISGNGEIEVPEEFINLTTDKKGEARFVQKFGNISINIKTTYNSILLNTK
jgi:hypothetical protein